MTSRPLTKDVLKRMFLKVLWEIKRPNGKLPGENWSSGHILGSTLPHYFQLKNLDPDYRSQWSLTKKENEDAMLGIEELQRAGYLRDDPSQDPRQFKLLTERGERYAARELENMD